MTTNKKKCLFLQMKLTLSGKEMMISPSIILIFVQDA